MYVVYGEFVVFVCLPAWCVIHGGRVCQRLGFVVSMVTGVEYLGFWGFV